MDSKKIGATLGGVWRKASRNMVNNYPDSVYSPSYCQFFQCLLFSLLFASQRSDRCVEVLSCVSVLVAVDSDKTAPDTGQGFSHLKNSLKKSISVEVYTLLWIFSLLYLAIKQPLPLELHIPLNITKYRCIFKWLNQVFSLLSHTQLSFGATTRAYLCKLIWIYCR